MTRRFGAVGVAAAVAALTAACGAAEEPRPEASTPGSATRTTLYFLTENEQAPLGVRRTIAKDTPPVQGASLRGTLKALLDGPTSDEQAAGITTAIPEGAELVTLTSRGYGGTGAVVDISGLSSVDDPLNSARVITQIVRTLLWSGYIERVWIRSDRRPWGMHTMDGGIDNGPFDYDTLHGFWLGAGCPGTETVECDSFRALP